MIWHCERASTSKGKQRPLLRRANWAKKQFFFSKDEKTESEDVANLQNDPGSLEKSVWKWQLWNGNSIWQKSPAFKDRPLNRSFNAYPERSDKVGKNHCKPKFNFFELATFHKLGGWKRRRKLLCFSAFRFLDCNLLLINFDFLFRYPFMTLKTSSRRCWCPNSMPSSVCWML